MTCERYPGRAVLPLSDSPFAAEFGGCTHAHPSAFEGEAFPCSGNLGGGA